MIHDFSTRHPDIIRLLKKEVGSPFTVWQRIKMKGIGSGRLKIAASSPRISALLGDANVMKFMSIEMRPKGIIIHFKRNLVHYIWPIPYVKLAIYNTEKISFHSEGEYITVYPTHLKHDGRRFVKKIGMYKLDYLMATGYNVQ